MEIIASPAAMQRWSEDARRRGETIAFVPTMGFLHEGHLTLMREGRARATLLASSLFVNPTRFGPNEDFSRYPRNFEGDCELMRSGPVDALFAPEPEVMFPAGSQTWVEATEVTRGLCGDHRPGHFRGVATVVAKLFNIVKPHLALFGEHFYRLPRQARNPKDDDPPWQISRTLVFRQGTGTPHEFFVHRGASNRRHVDAIRRMRLDVLQQRAP